MPDSLEFCKELNGVIIIIKIRNISSLDVVKALKPFKTYKIKFYYCTISNLGEVSRSDRGTIIYLMLLMQGIESNPGPLKPNSKTNLIIKECFVTILKVLQIKR